MGNLSVCHDTYTIARCRLDISALKNVLDILTGSKPIALKPYNLLNSVIYLLKKLMIQNC